MYIYYISLFIHPSIGGTITELGQFLTVAKKQQTRPGCYYHGEKYLVVE